MGGRKYLNSFNINSFLANKKIAIRGIRTGNLSSINPCFITTILIPKFYDSLTILELMLPIECHKTEIKIKMFTS